jgi:DNA-binding XRE family transcriptional regulator
MKGAVMSELENIKPVAFYRADWKGDMMFRKDNTVIIRKNEGDFTTGWIKPLYDELPEPQPQLTIPKSIAESLERQNEDIYEEECFEELVWDWTYEKEREFNNENPDKFTPQNIYQEHYNRLALCRIYLESLTLGVDLVKVVETDDQ